jgi:hypothetical protein
VALAVVDLPAGQERRLQGGGHERGRGGIQGRWQGMTAACGRDGGAYLERAHTPVGRKAAHGLGRERGAPVFDPGERWRGGGCFFSSNRWVSVSLIFGRRG